MTTQIRLRTLLKEDPIYREWFTKPPLVITFHTGRPWRLFVQAQEDGRWARVDLPGYVKAYTQVRLRLPDVWDMAIHCKPQRFHPPVVRWQGKKVYLPVPQGHEWCELCRRPTVFRFFRYHPNLTYPCDVNEKRCSICGARRVSMKTYSSPLVWPVEKQGIS